MYFANERSKIYIMHPKGVYIMPQLCGGTAIVFHPRSQNIMYRLKPTLCTDYVGIMYLATARHRDKDFLADIFVTSTARSAQPEAIHAKLRFDHIQRFTLITYIAHAMITYNAFCVD